MGYICEARPLHFGGQYCHFPFVYEGVTYDSCARDVASIGIITSINQKSGYNLVLFFTLDSEGNPWCAIAVNSANNEMSVWNLCPDEKKIAIAGGAEGQFCNVPFLMDRM